MNKKDADAEAARFLLRLNDGTLTPESTMSIRQFVENFYLPHIEQEKRVSTFKGYSHLWSRHLRENCDIALRDFRTFHGEKMLRDIARTTTLNKTSLAHIKAFLSGVFRYARRLGILREENPIRDVVLPKAPPPNETHAYSLEDILRMLVVVPEPAATAVAVAAFTGARRGEIRGMLWENFKENQISITQSVFGSHIDEPKSPKSKAPVPVIAPLAKFLERHRRTSGNPSTGLIFRTPSGTSMELGSCCEVCNSSCFGQGENIVAWLARLSSRACNQPLPPWRARQDHSGGSPARQCLNDNERLREVGTG